MRKIINHPTLALLAGAGTLVALLAASPAQAATHHHSAQWHMAHYIQCFNLIGSPSHAKVCGSNGPSAAGLASAWNFVSTPAAAPPAPVTKAPCVPPPCCWHWCCKPPRFA